MPKPLVLHPDRLFPSDPTVREIARRLYGGVAKLPIISPHGHTDPAWFAYDQPFENATDLLLTPDHYLFRMLFSQRISLESLGVISDDNLTRVDPRSAWRLFAENFYLFRGTPSAIWLNHVFAEVFGLDIAFDAHSADYYFDYINDALATPAFRPRALFEQFNIELLATTESPSDDLIHHRAIRDSGWKGNVVTAYRPDPVVNAEDDRFGDAMRRFAELSGQDVYNWTGYLEAHRIRRAAFREFGATSTDHGHPTAFTADLSTAECEALFKRIIAGNPTKAEAELFRGQMLTEMAKMSIEDGMVMQLHPGAFRNHNAPLFARFGRDKGADIPTVTEYVNAMKPLLDRFGSDHRLSLIVFTLDESVYARELAPMAGVYPALKLGPPWWFHDSVEGMRRFREQTTETAGFYNTAGFNDDTRAFLSIPARHDVARRMDCGFLARLVAEHRMDEADAHEVAHELAYDLAKRAYRLDAVSSAAPKKVQKVRVES